MEIEQKQNKLQIFIDNPLIYKKYMNNAFTFFMLVGSVLFLVCPKDKTNKYCKGCTRLVARTGRPSCPHSMLLRYAKLAKEDITSREFLFRALGFSRITGHFLQPCTKLFHTSAREVIFLKLKAIGLDTSKHNWPSFL